MHITHFQMSCLTYYSKLYKKHKNTHTHTKPKKSNKKAMMTMTMMMTMTLTTRHHHCHNLRFLIQTAHSLNELQFLAAPYKFSHLSNVVILTSCRENSLLSCHQNSFQLVNTQDPS
jgi:hypothetical protein